MQRLKPLQVILHEFVQLKQKELERERLIKSFGVEHALNQTMSSLVNLLEDYNAQRHRLLAQSRYNPLFNSQHDKR